jgi:hypothetical protein
MAVHAPGKVFGLGTFTGLPEDWRNPHKKGHFNLHGRFPPDKDNVELVAGLFHDTLVPFLERHPGDKLAVAHLDADLYSATVLRAAQARAARRARRCSSLTSS